MMSSGQMPSFSNLYDELCNTLSAKGKVSIITDGFMKNITDEERVAFVLDQPEVHQYIQPVIDKITQKSATVSKELREKGNQYYKSRDYNTSLDHYIKSVLYAPFDKDDESLSLAFANCSAVLFQLENYEECIGYIESAYVHSYPSNMRFKLSERQAKCFAALRRFEEAQECFERAVKEMVDVRMDNKKRQKLEKSFQEYLTCSKSKFNLPNVMNKMVISSRRNVPLFKGETNSTFPSLSAATEVSYQPGRGRYIVAKEYLPPGHIVLIEKPFASVLLADHIVSNCHHCYKQLSLVLPCESCVYAAFCSKECQSMSLETYHRYECQCLSALYKSGLDKFAHLALRTVAKQPLKALLKYKEERTQDQEEIIKGCSKDGRYMYDDYHTINTLVTHSSDRAPHDLYKRAVTAVFLMKCLLLSGYFSNKKGKDTLLTKENQSYIGGLLLSHLQLLPCNAHEISELPFDPNNIGESTTSEIGAGIYATLSLFNHSCNPNVTRNFYGSTCVVRTICAVHPGEEVADNYGAVYEIMERKQRHEILTPQYYFQCQCEACKADWPSYQTLHTLPTLYRCIDCLVPWDKHIKVLKEGKNNNTVCNKTAVEMKKQLKMLEEAEKNFAANFQKLLDGKYKEALPEFLKYLELMDGLIPPHKNISSCQEAVKQCYNLMSNCKVISK